MTIPERLPATAIPERYLADARERLLELRSTAERALSQVADPDFFAALDPESNSLAILVKHVAGNLRSRWMDFLTSDGEKPDRRRDAEFVVEYDSRSALMRAWAEGWDTLFAAFDALTPADLGRTVTIRGEPLSALSAINRQLVHNANHVGQIVLLCKHFAGASWRTLSIPRGESDAFTARLRRAQGPERTAGSEHTGS